MHFVCKLSLFDWLLRGQIVLAEPQSKIAISRLERPTPRLMLGLELYGIATSAIDISDGLVADLGHICERSSLGARLELAVLPTSSTMKEQVTLSSWKNPRLMYCDINTIGKEKYNSKR